ncbi:MAG: cadherin-like beta sandwich domain-containing protein [Nitrospira sp.]
MKHVRTISGPRWAAGLIIAIAVSAYGCGDSASVSEDVEVPLSSLAVSPGSLRPAFSPNTTSYQFNAPTAASSVTVTAAPQNSTTTMTINGNQTAAEQVRSIPLGPPGSTIPIPITLTSQTGGESTYTVTITRLLSSDNNLKTLTVTQGTLSPAFASDQLTYTVDVATNISTVTLTATKSDPEAVISDGLNNDGRAEIPLGGPGTNKTVSITVTAPNGSSQTYIVTINRAASGNNNLSALRVEAET